MAHGPQRPSEIARLSLEAVSAYRVFANDPAHGIELPPDDPVELTRRMTQTLGRSVAVPDLSRAGYHLVGGRVLAVMYGPAGMLVYEDAAHNRITVYIQPMRVGEETPMRSVDAGAVDGYAWINRQIGYGVVSEGDRARAPLHREPGARRRRPVYAGRPDAGYRSPPPRGRGRRKQLRSSRR